LNKDRTLQSASDEPARRLLEAACRPTAFALLIAAEREPITRVEAGQANGSTPESADQVLTRLRSADLLRTGPRRGRHITYELTEVGQAALDVVRTYGHSLPPPSGGWWITVKRGRSASPTELRSALAAYSPSRLHRCVGDFDFAAALDDRENVVDVLDALFESLRTLGAVDIAAARIEDTGWRDAAS
jgi:hypothetical protein